MYNGYFCLISLKGVMRKNLKGVFILDPAQSQEKLWVEPTR